jgi:hypothetical protein
MEFEIEKKIFLKEIFENDLVNEDEMIRHFLMSWYYLLTQWSSETDISINQIINLTHYKQLRFAFDKIISMKLFNERVEEILINSKLTVDCSDSGYFFGRKSDQKIINKFQICLFYAIDESTVNFYLKFNEKLVDDPSCLNKMLDHYTNILHAIVNQRDEESELHKVQFLTEYDKQFLLNFNSTNSSYEHENQHFVEIFENVVDKNPFKTALVFEESSATFDELNKKSNRIAHYLRIHHNIKREDIIGVCFSRGIDMIPILLGILKSGAAYLPLDSNYPRERLDYMIEDSKVALIITENKLLGLLESWKSKVIILENLSEKIESQSDENPRAVNTIEDMIYLLYTSGSTGKPKGKQFFFYLFFKDYIFFR